MHVMSHFLTAAILLLSYTRGDVRVTDDLGHVITLPAPAQRIVSLAPSLTESLFAIGAGSQVVGRTEFCDYPPDATHIPSIGGMINPSIEAIVARRPDLIVVSMEGNTREDFSHLNSLGVPVYVSNPRTLVEIYHSLNQLGILSGKQEEARHLTDSLQRYEQTLRRARAEHHPVSALLLVSLQPLMVVGKNTLPNELLTLAGARNLAASLVGHYPTISRETVLANPPDVLFITSDLPADSAALLSLFPEWKHLRALRDGRLYRLDASIISRPGPRSLDGLHMIIDCLTKGTP